MRHLTQGAPPIAIGPTTGRCPVCRATGRHNQGGGKKCLACGGTGYWYKEAK
jgi:hypothetical protein